MPSTHERLAFDAHALLAWFRNEPTANTVEAFLRDGEAGRAKLLLSTINLGEVLYNLERRHGERRAAAALNILRKLPVEIVDCTRQRVFHAARLKAGHGLGYADAFAAALAIEFDATLLTGDKDFRAVDGLVSIEWLSAG